ncbi:hypothetical protein PR202_gb11279 [Eleusine coracana subsp. coracana]|uniref:Glycosyltransferase n=1 Tax=Eleusine coracana subsp. coracana TaxID=191504 RepID=A0AAV5ELQ0_ELECO|nr:hypothetical protein PR202_gb11279 [Eleusine coracana subsp. coracana]
MDTADSSTMHIVIFPWLAFGHLLPALDLAERLASRGHRVSFVSTPRNISRLPPVAPALARLIDFVALPFPRVEGLPDGAESTNDVPFDKFDLHRKAFDALAAPFSAFLDAACAADGGGRRKLDWVLVDFIHHWVAAAALDRNVPCAMLVTFAAGVMASLGRPSSDDNSSRAEQHRQAIAQTMSAAPKFEADRAAKDFATETASGESVVGRFIQTVTRCRLVAIRSCPELEPDTFPLLTELYHKPVVPLGLLPPQPDGTRRVVVNNNTQDDDAIMRWLDAQPAKSVVYVALGSEVPLSVEQVHELAHGLELAGPCFLWALRKPNGVVLDDADVLPPGFEERTRDRGLVATGWVPQVRILAHGAVGAFLTHCGWGSLVEGLRFGHPLIMLPIFGDQGPNARFMEARKVGVLVPRNDMDGSFSRDGVAAAVRAVVAAEEGTVLFAQNARKLQEIVADNERHERCIDGFIQHLRSCKE